MSIDSVSSSGAAFNLGETVRMAQKKETNFEELTHLKRDDSDEEGSSAAEILDAEGQSQGIKASISGMGSASSGSGSNSDEEYDEYDFNKDGMVTPDELMQAFQQGDTTLRSLLQDMGSTASSMTTRLGMEAYLAQSIL